MQHGRHPGDRTPTPSHSEYSQLPFKVRAQMFDDALRDWGYVFMFAVWLQSIMACAIAMKRAGASDLAAPRGTRSREFCETRDGLLQMGMAGVWREFKAAFGAVSPDEEHTAAMIILIRDQLAHCAVSSGTGYGLFAPKRSSRQRLESLKDAGWIEIPREGVATPEVTIVRAGDRKWHDTNIAMMQGFAENTLCRLTRAHGIDDGRIH